MKRWLVLVAVASALGGWAASTASARILHYLVTVTVTGPGRVAGTGDGGTIDCPGACSVLIRQGTSLTLAARPSENATFASWGGDCASFGNASECTVTGANDKDPKSITAGFDEAPPPPPMAKLTVQKAGSGNGYVGGAGGIDCGPTCTSSFVAGTKVTLIAAADDGSTFGGWDGGGCSGTEQCTVTLGADTTVTATFTHVDRDPPRLRTIRGSAARGTTAHLRFRVYDDSGRTREALTLFSGKAPVGRVAVPIAHTKYGVTYTARFRVPKTSTPGTWLYCALAVDEAGNESKRSCSPFRIT